MSRTLTGDNSISTSPDKDDSQLWFQPDSRDVGSSADLASVIK